MISRNAQVHKNTFQSGVNKDFNKTLVPSESMVDASNVSIIDNGVFFSVQNIKGTVNVQDILNDADTEVLGVFPMKYQIAGVSDIPCLTIFTATEDGGGNNFKIWAYDTLNDDLYELYEEVVSSDYFTPDRAIDARLLGENGVSILYFTDDYNEPRKLRCEIPGSYTPNFLNSFDLSLLRRGALGKVVLDSVGSGGSLFTGSYQFAYQLFTPEKNKYTKWSLLSNPIFVYSGTPPKAGYGLSSNKQITLDINLKEDEAINYTHFRLAVLENIYPEWQENESCSLTQTYSFADYLSGSTLSNIEFKSNLQNNLVPLSDVVVDHSQIAHVKTLEIRDNRLLFGNITYKNLTYDNGTPAISSGSIIKQNVAIQTESQASAWVGYYRDEVYRYAISYFDENGNYSSPSPLDMTNVTNNQSSQSGFQDMKFPKRSDVLGGTRYSILSDKNPVHLGLTFTGIDNHPTWAKGFVILRRERLKNIQWQSPLLPMMEVAGLGAIIDYPTIAREQADSGTVNYPDATPMGPSKTFVPMNLFWPKLRGIIFNTTKTGNGVNQKYEGEPYMGVLPNQSMSQVFPPQTIYTQNSKYNFNQSHRLETIDACKVQELRTKHSTESSFLGARIDSSYSGTFYAMHDSLYYYDDSHSGSKPALRSSLFTMNAYKDFDNFSEGTSINGSDVMLYSNLTTGTISWSGVKNPNIQRCGVVDINEFESLNEGSTLDFADGGTSVEPYSTSVQYDATNRGTPDTEGSAHVQTIEIVNCTADLSDDRYGDVGTPQSYIYTGTSYTFTNAELPTVEAGSSLPKSADVWGGDCVVTAHTFKTIDTSFNVINNTKYNSPAAGQTMATAISHWRRGFAGNGPPASVITMPVAIKNSNTYIQIYLESEFNGYVLDYNNLSIATGSTYLTNSLYGVNYNNEESSCRVPLNYNYNINLSKQNNNKIFSSVDPNIPVTTSLGARILYSDIKLYQTQTEGFDIFRVLNYHDLLETYGGITKLQLVGDNLYALQTSAISHIGIGERVIETTDSSQLAVRSNEFIGTVSLISNARGCQHIRSVATDGGSMFFVDNLNKSVNRVGGQEVQLISDFGMATEFRTQLISEIPENELIGVYDPIKKEYLIGRNNGNFCWVYNAGLGIWVSNYTFINDQFLGGAYTNQKLYLVGRNTIVSDYISVHEMYTGPSTFLMGAYYAPYIKIVANPSIEIAKTFDDILVNASDRLDTFDILIERESALGNQTISGIDLDVSSRGEGNFRVKALRDASNRRPRGLYGVYTINWNSSVSSPQVNLTSVLTKYKTSENIF